MPSRTQPARGVFSKRDRDKCVAYLPLLQVIGKLHPASRLVLLKHLDQQSLSAVVNAIRVVLSGVSAGDKCYPASVVKKMKDMVRSNPSAFKTLLQSRSSRISKPQQSALFSIGGSVIGAILSVVVPLVVGALLKKKKK